MKNLLYKEFKLALHPICIVLIALFPFMVFIPSYPLCISFIYVCVCYPIIFLGANKGVQTNDLLFSMLLPVRRKDIVLARMILCSILQFSSIILSSILSVFARASVKDINTEALEKLNLTMNGTQLRFSGIGFGFNEIIFVYCFVLLAFCIYDFVFFVSYYRNGHSIFIGTLGGILLFTLSVMLTTIILPLQSKDYFSFFANMSVVFRALIFLFSVLIYVACHY